MPENNSVEAYSISVIIPTLNAEGEIGALLDALMEQSLRPSEILVIDSASDDRTAAEVQSRKGVNFDCIERRCFNHGLTRDSALRHTSGEFVCFLTQDAMPASRFYLSNLIKPMLNDSSIALVSGRQLPKPDARRFEQLVRGFNYPSEPAVRSIEDVPICGIKTFFASDACSAYKREAYLACGGFSEVNTNEDMLMAAHLIAKNYKIAYEPSAEVYHSHNFSPREEYRRNYAIGKFLEEHSEELMGTSEIGEGIRLAKKISKQLMQEKQLGELLAFGIDCSARFLGNKMGRREVRKSIQ